MWANMQMMSNAPGLCGGGDEAPVEEQPELL